MLATLIWNPDRNIFVIPYINHPITWYGLLFALGFVIGFFLIRKMFAEFLQTFENQPDVEAVKLTDRLTLLVAIGAVLGARLGHVFFYDWHYYRLHPQNIFKLWEGGLASHGAAIGIFLALLVFVYLSRKQVPKLTFLTALDALVVPVAFAGGCIRIGNFINQEITGIPTTLPWGVIFMDPLDGVSGVGVHPVQLYESLFYFFVFCLLFSLWRFKKAKLGEGLLSGWFFLLVFGFRFLVEYLKMPQNEFFDVAGWLTMGQLLSIPLILLGVVLLVRYCYVGKKG